MVSTRALRPTPSSNQMDMTQWNSFDPELITSLIDKYDIEFVDLPNHDPYRYWQNKHDTAVFQIKLRSIADALSLLRELRYADEVDWIELSSTPAERVVEEAHKARKQYEVFVFRLWWD